VRLAFLRAALGALALAAAPRTPRAQQLAASGGGTVTVGDTVTIVLRATLPAGATIAGDPHPRDSLPSSVRLYALDTLPPSAGGAARYRARIGFFQTGSLTSPAFALPYRRAGAEAPDSVVSGAVLVTVTPTLPDTAIAMRDIRPFAALGGSSGGGSRWWLVAVLALVLAAAVAVGLRARARGGAPAARPAVAEPPLGAYEAARERLEALAASNLAARDVAGVYDHATDALRRYLEAVHDTPAIHRTTPELLAALPAGLAATRAAARALLGDADLVKFARLRPGASAAGAFVERAIQLLDAWHEAEPAPAGAGAPAAAQEADALR